MDSDEVSLIGKRLSGLPYSFVLDEISSRFSIEDSDLPELRRMLDGSQDFIRTLDDENKEERHIAKRTLYTWFVNLSLRLAVIKFCTLNKDQLLSKLNSLRLTGTWNYPPNDYIQLGQNFGFLSRFEKQDRYNFPISAVMSFFTQYGIEAAREYLLNRSYNADITPQFQESITEGLRNALENLEKSRQQYVILRRHGILGFDKMTLQEIGQQLHVTREYIRQIEQKCWKRIWHPAFRYRLVPLLLIYVLNRKGSLLVTSANIQREIKFICKCLYVPTWTFPYTKVMCIGSASNSINLPDDIWRDLSNLETNIKDFLSALSLQLTQEDVDKIADMLIPIVLKRLTRTQKVYLALKRIGEQAHFSDVRDMFMCMFPGEYTTEHSIHATLLREKHGVVWIGSKGTFALEEWGYQRPTSSLVDTIAQIVEQKYRVTGSPVHLIVIQAEIGKHRKIMNLNSLLLASYFNPRLRYVGDSCFVPREQANDEEEIEDSELDRALREFEKHTEGINRIERET